MKRVKIKLIYVCLVVIVVASIFSLAKPPRLLWKVILQKRAVMEMEQRNYIAAKSYLLRLLSLDTNNIIALKNLGNVEFVDRHFHKAEFFFQKGRELGDKYCLKMLAYTYIELKNIDDLALLVPELLRNVDDPDFSNAILIYSVLSKDKDLFLRIEPVLDSSRKDTAELIDVGHKEFGISNAL